ncbi:ATP-dependent RNA helicase DbpA [Nannocystis sp. RBIL2]|uniref:ATP-dependent RNA helicase DbpA n=1 Tax=Nannocystis sp. RBIL2 TaxID=2996788 RepID=UPI00226D762B|nr:ATP-dependent RNA helicase DbpA [Nannocystis sp. RBIL2]MCY1070555.1 ATP-dependent RNA helicase DbpA [Nannocystis sp. RBIL2]
MTDSTTTTPEPSAATPGPQETFAALSLAPPLAQALAVLGLSHMTPVQAHALPSLLEGKDVIAQASTGSGKTVAFGLALLACVDVDLARVQALVLCPTRELADQVSTVLRRLARFIANLRVVTLCGGVPVRTQKPALQAAPHIVVGTPGRILDHLARDNLELSGLRVLVLDEADRMLDMGFLESITAIVEQAPSSRQTMLFSATYPEDIRALSRRLQRNPVTVTVDDVVSRADIEQTFFAVEPARKLDALAALLSQHRPESALVFCHTRNDVREVSAQLARRGFSVLALHGELEQRERDEVLLRFANKSCAVLVATDVAARGLDIQELSMVVSWELPTDPDVHLHRIGRTGRAGRKGRALALCSPFERERVAALERAQGTPLRWEALPSPDDDRPTRPPMTTLVIEGGRQDKLRAGDLLGALTGDIGLPGEVVGKIDILARHTYVAIRSDRAELALKGLRAGKIKGRSFRARVLK